MVNMTLAIPDGLHEKMKQFSDIKCSEVARRAIEQRINDLETMDRIASKSKLTEKDAKEIGDKIKRNIAKRHGLTI